MPHCETSMSPDACQIPLSNVAARLARVTHWNMNYGDATGATIPPYPSSPPSTGRSGPATPTSLATVAAQSRLRQLPPTNNGTDKDRQPNRLECAAAPLVVLITFGVVLSRILLSSARQPPNASLMLGALSTMTTAVVSYWVGSSAGSAAQDKLLRGR